MPLSTNAKIGIGVAAVAVVASGVLKRKAIYKVGKMAFDATKQAAFAQLLPDGAKPYAADILKVADEMQVSPFLIVGFGQVESGWGSGSGYLPKGSPAGTGDRTARLATKARVAAAGSLGQVVSVLPAGWSPGRDADGNPTTGPWVIPADGGGYGRGYFQMDIFTGARGVDLSDVPAQMRAAIKLLQAKMRAVNVLLTKAGKPALAGDELLQAGVAAYNTGEGNVVKSLTAGKPVDATTAGGGYSARVLGYATKLASAMGVA